ncbi:hypothetical protein C2845_PM07G01690 [Panicum miliaceum]|uniref:Uncharacterized protein n=1 Tax=Panicum miliaceum TaxID=4540 RepID=A0A3L6STG0_PANMI|nr:hypothetical protein C2845_PM07G01690 [Panicum miliaceum]
MATTPQLAIDDDNINNEVRIDIPGDEILDGIAPGNSRKFARKLRGGHQIAYYLILLGFFLAGVAEVFAGSLLYWGQDGGRVRAYGVPLFFASVVLLAALIALGGTPFIVMG